MFPVPSCGTVHSHNCFVTFSFNQPTNQIASRNFSGTLHHALRTDACFRYRKARFQLVLLRNFDPRINFSFYVGTIQFIDIPISGCMRGMQSFYDEHLTLISRDSVSRPDWKKAGCAIQEDCRHMGADCVSGVCECPAPNIYDALTGYCITRKRKRRHSDRATYTRTHTLRKRKLPSSHVMTTSGTTV